MEKFITVATFSLPTELAVIKGRLESEGIECITQDELTVQVHNFYSNAIGGVKLQVKEVDVPRAIEILKDTGHLTDEDFKPPEFWLKLDQWTKRIPLLMKARVELRFIVIIAVILSAVASLLYLAST